MEANRRLTSLKLQASLSVLTTGSISSVSTLRNIDFGKVFRYADRRELELRYFNDAGLHMAFRPFQSSAVVCIIGIFCPWCSERVEKVVLLV